MKLPKTIKDLDGDTITVSIACGDVYVTVKSETNAVCWAGSADATVNLIAALAKALSEAHA